METRYVLENIFVNKKLLELISKKCKNGNQLRQCDNNEILTLKSKDKVLIILNFKKDIKGKYYLDIDFDLDLLRQAGANMYFLILNNGDAIPRSLIEDFQNGICKHLEIESFNKIINDCYLSQSSIIESFNMKLLNANSVKEMNEFFLSITNSDQSDSNYHFLILEKLDQLQQNIGTLIDKVSSVISLPFYFRGHSLSYRLTIPLRITTKAIIKILKVSRVKFTSVPKEISLSPYPDYLVKFFEIANAKKTSIDKIRFKKVDQPEVSIIIPVYGKIQYLEKCLYSLFIAKNNIAFEIIIVDDCGPQNIKNKLLKSSKIDIKCIRNNENKGFTKSCNIGAKNAKGKYLCFLNSDTVVTDNWLDNLINGFIFADNIGIVGSRLLHNNGSLQESGGIIFNNAEAANIGRNQNVENSWFRYYKDVDYVSGAALAITAKDFNKLNGFDDRFSPAYYEDTSLCMDVRHKLNKRVSVNPLSTVIHAEGATNGTDLSSGMKKFQTINKNKFLDKHKLDLINNYGEPFVNLWWDRDKYIKGNVLIVDQCIPSITQDSGSKDMDNILKALLELNLRPHFFATSNRAEVPEVYGYLEKGVHCVYDNENILFKNFYKKYNKLFDLVIISRVNTAEEVLPIIKTINNSAKTLFYTVDLHHIRAYSEFDLTKDSLVLDEAIKLKSQELKTIELTDKTIVLSNKEKDYLEKRCNVDPSKLEVWPLIRNEFDNIKNYKKTEDPNDIIFIGGFSHTPNVEAVKILKNDLLPYASEYFNKKGAELPVIKIYGSKPNSYIKNLNSKYLEYIGFIENESDAFKTARLSLAPLPYGAGVKGKVLSSFLYKTPVVGSSFAFEGFDDLESRFAYFTNLDKENFAKVLYKAYIEYDSKKLDLSWQDFYNKLDKQFSYNSFKDTLEAFLKSEKINV